MKQVLVIGGGFAGLWASLAAARERHLHDADFSITLISFDEYLTIRPRLYESDPEKLRVPLLSSLEPVAVDFVKGNVQDIDTGRQHVELADGDNKEVIQYDKLILAAGSQLTRLPVPGADDYMFNVDDFEAALEFDRHLHKLVAGSGRAAPVFAVVGAGFTGIEIALELRSRIEVHGGRERARRARILLLDRAEHLGAELGDDLRPLIRQSLEKADIQARVNTGITRVNQHSMVLSSGETIETDMVINATGLRANPLAELIAGARDKLGRIQVDEFLRASAAKNIFACGDVASAFADSSHKALMSCQHAMPMGKFAGYNAAREILGLDLRAYSQPDYVTCLDLGVSGAVFTRGWDRQIQMTGDEAKKLKQSINREWIYPPSGDRDSIFEQASLDAKSKRSHVEV